MYKHMANSGNCVLWNSDQVGDTEGGKEREVKEEVVCVIPLTAAYLSIHGCSVPVDSCPRMPCPVYFFTKFARSVTQPCFFVVVFFFIIIYRSNSPNPETFVIQLFTIMPLQTCRLNTKEVFFKSSNSSFSYNDSS